MIVPISVSVSLGTSFSAEDSRTSARARGGNVGFFYLQRYVQETNIAETSPSLTAGGGECPGDS